MIELRDAAFGVLEIVLAGDGPRASLTWSDFNELAGSWKKAEKLGITCVVITGGPEFCSGADLATLGADAACAHRAGRNVRQILHDAVLRDRRLSVPVVVAVEGACVGAGMELAGAADLRIAGRAARFGLPEVRRGLLPSGGSLARLPSQLPWAVVSEIVLGSRMLSANRLLELGFLNEVVADGSAREAGLAMAARIAQASPTAVREALQVMTTAVRETRAQALSAELDADRRMMHHPDSREGPRSFLERRAPNWGAVSESAFGSRGQIH